MHDTARRAIAGEVRAALARADRTQRDLAAVLGIAQPATWARLRGDRSFRAEEIVAIAAWLGVPVTALIPVDTAPAPTHPAPARPTQPPPPPPPPRRGGLVAGVAGSPARPAA